MTCMVQVQPPTECARRLNSSETVAMAGVDVHRRPPNKAWPMLIALTCRI
jgi:hypothetical protein